MVARLAAAGAATRADAMAAIAKSRAAGIGSAYVVKDTEQRQ